MGKKNIFIIVIVGLVIFTGLMWTNNSRGIQQQDVHDVKYDNKVVAEETESIEQIDVEDNEKISIEKNDEKKKALNKKKEAAKKRKKEAKAEAERKAAEAERKAAEEAARAEAERKAVEEAAKIQAEQKANENTQQEISNEPVIQPSNPDAGCIDDASDILTY